MVIYWLVIFFVFLMLFSGICGYFKTKSVDDFVIGNRNVGPWLSAFAYGTTYFSAVLFIGYAGKIGYNFGLKSLWIAIGNAVLGSFLAWKVLAKKTREMTAKLNARTMPEFLSARYNCRAYKYLSAFIIFIFLVPYSASVYMGLSYFFESVFKIPYLYALLLMAGLTTVYLLLGGYNAVALADFIQGLIMIGGVFLMVYFLLSNQEINGFINLTNKLRDINPSYTEIWGGKGFSSIMFLMFLTSLGTWGMPQMVQKFYAIKDVNSIKPATYISSAFALIIAVGAYLTGSMTPVFFKGIPIDPVLMKPNPDLLIPQMLSSYVPEWVTALIFLLVLSASMSTLSSLVLVSSSAVTVDFLVDLGVLKSDKKQVFTLRFLSLVFICLSVYIALKKPTIILSLMAISWGAVSGAFLAPYIYGLFSKKANINGALTGTITGLLITVVFSLRYNFDPAKLPAISVMSMLIPMIIVPVVSSFTKKE
ncbi:MAG: sodium/solute symporter [Proteobacteria bacterium]|nr:sodium/solute symporter [Pseudomonadota bacterium]